MERARQMKRTPAVVGGGWRVANSSSRRLSSSLNLSRNNNNNNSNNNNFLFANILEDQAQWRDKTKGLSKLVIVNNA